MLDKSTTKRKREMNGWKNTIKINGQSPFMDYLSLFQLLPLILIVKMNFKGYFCWEVVAKISLIQKQSEFNSNLLNL